MTKAPAPLTPTLVTKGAAAPSAPEAAIAPAPPPAAVLTPTERAMTWERMSGERLPEAERERILAGGDFHPPSGDAEPPVKFALRTVEGRRQVGLRVTAEMDRDLRVMSMETGRTMNDILIDFITKGLEARRVARREAARGQG